MVLDTISWEIIAYNVIGFETMDEKNVTIYT